MGTVPECCNCVTLKFSFTHYGSVWEVSCSTSLFVSSSRQNEGLAMNSLTCVSVADGLSVAFVRASGALRWKPSCPWRVHCDHCFLRNAGLLPAVWLCWRPMAALSWSSSGCYQLWSITGFFHYAICGLQWLAWILPPASSFFFSYCFFIMSANRNLGRCCFQFHLSTS